MSTAHRDWADAWIEALASFSHPGRMRRGQQFFARGRIRRLAVVPGTISAVVREGDQGFQVELQLEVIEEDLWEQMTARLATQAIYSARLLAGEIPLEVIEVFADAGAPLFPEARTLQARCTCPDWEVPCKHVAALYYYLADRFEEDPFLLFLARGRSKEQFLASLRRWVAASLDAPAASLDTLAATAASQPPPFDFPPAGYDCRPLASLLERFWDMAEEANPESFHIAPPATPLLHLQRLGPPPFMARELAPDEGTPRRDLIEILAPIYEIITQKALESDAVRKAEASAPSSRPQDFAALRPSSIVNGLSSSIRSYES